MVKDSSHVDLHITRPREESSEIFRVGFVDSRKIDSLPRPDRNYQLIRAVAASEVDRDPGGLYRERWIMGVSALTMQLVDLPYSRDTAAGSSE